LVRTDLSSREDEKLGRGVTFCGLCPSGQEECEFTVTGFEAAVARHQRRVFSFAHYFLGNPSEAEDVVQEVLLRLWQNWHKLDTERLEPWLTRVTRNACYDLLRKRRSTSRYMAPDTDDDVTDRAPSNRPSPEAKAEASDFRKHLLAALRKLDEPMRSILILREIQGLKYQEIADILAMPINTVRVYLHRGRQRLRKQLGRVYDHVPTG
jgi:RNA polymerase sigma-70 factor (ECF subfamily)